VRWNGVEIARNGRVGRSAAEELPGRYRFVAPVPASLVRPGDNRLSATLSAEHQRWRVRYPLHRLHAAAYEDATFGPYLPALLAMGTLALAAAYFTAAALIQRQRESASLSFIALLSLAQLALEVARVFVPYRYVWHMPRVAAIAALAALTALVAVDHAARRMVPERRLAVLAATALVITIVMAVVPAYDPKAEGALLVGALGLLGLGCAGFLARRSGARETAAIGLGFALLILFDRGLFLDSLYYVAMAALLATFVVAHLGARRRAPTADAPSAPARSTADDSLVAIRDGIRTHLVPGNQIARVRAADDYSEVFTTDGRVLLATQTMAKLHASLPPDFRRVHKSHVVNGRHVASLARRPGGGWQLELRNGDVVPVGRAYAAAVSDWR
jgi:hypothetical protein